MNSQIINYKCPNCTGPLHYAGKSGRVECDYCGSSFTVAEVEAIYQRPQPTQENKTADEKPNPVVTASADWTYTADEWNADIASLHSLNCPACGAELVCDSATVTASCPYCGNPAMISGGFAGTMKPDFILPFQLDKAKAMTALQNYYKGKKLLPSEFASQNHIKEIKGVYVPFWLFDGQADADMTFEGEIVQVHETKHERITETDVFRLERNGTVLFKNIPVDASSKIPDDYMDSIEPFDFRALKPFSTGYLTGYFADRYDVSINDAIPRANARAVQTAAEAMRDSCSKYSSVQEKRRNICLHPHQVKYVLLPVWLLSTQWNGENFLFAMNGQTGKLIGNLPLSTSRRNAMFWKTAALTAAICLPIFSFLFSRLF